MLKVKIILNERRNNNFIWLLNNLKTGRITPSSIYITLQIILSLKRRLRWITPSSMSSFNQLLLFIACTAGIWSWKRPWDGTGGRGGGARKTPLCNLNTAHLAATKITHNNVLIIFNFSALLDWHNDAIWRHHVVILLNLLPESKFPSK